MGTDDDVGNVTIWELVCRIKVKLCEYDQKRGEPGMRWGHVSQT